MRTARRAVVRGGSGLARPERPVYSLVNSQHEDRLGEERRSAGLPRHRLAITARQESKPEERRLRFFEQKDLDLKSRQIYSHEVKVLRNADRLVDGEVAAS